MGILGIILLTISSVILFPFIWVVLCFIFNVFIITFGFILSILGINYLFSKQTEKIK